MKAFLFSASFCPRPRPRLFGSDFEDKDENESEDHSHSTLVSEIENRRELSRLEQKDQRMKIRLPLPAFAGILSVSIHMVSATTIPEVFDGDPLTNGWFVHGEANLFQWNSANKDFEVTWDSAKSNSYFLHGTETLLTKDTDFMLGFDLRLSDIGPGPDPEKPFTFQIAIGFLNLAQATNSNFIRGSGFDAPNLVEFDYFWDSGFGATVSPVLISTNNEYNSGGFTFPLELTTNTLFQIRMLYLAEDRTLRTYITSNGVPIGPVQDASVATAFSDFNVDHFGVFSYNDAGQFPGFEGSVLAHGTMDNFMFAVPPPVTKVKALPDGAVEFRGTTNWVYHLERTTGFQSWKAVSAAVNGVSGTMSLQDTNPPSGAAFYRVQAEYHDGE